MAKPILATLLDILKDLPEKGEEDKARAILKGLIEAGWVLISSEEYYNVLLTSEPSDAS